MSVYRPKRSPFYHYDFEVEGRRFSGSTKLKGRREAERFESQTARPAARAELDAARATPTGPLTWGRARDRYWLEVGQHHAAGTSRNNTEWSLDWLTARIGRDTPLARIGTSKIADLVAQRRGDGVANATVNRSVTEPLRKVLRRASEVWGETLPKIVWREQTLPEPTERVRELSTEEEGAFLENIRPDYLPLFLFSLASGVRMSGCLELRWTDIDWGNRTIRIQGKADRHYTVPLSTTMREILWPLRAFHETVVFTYAAQRSRGGRKKGECYPITHSGLKTEFRRAREAAGLPSSWEDPERGYRWHDNRHTRATRLLRQTGNLKMVQRLLGHARIETTAKYAHVTMDDLREALDGEVATRSPGIIPEPARVGEALVIDENQIRQLR